MAVDIEKRIYELVEPSNPRSWRTFKITPLTGETSLNNTMKMDEEEALELLEDIFSEFGLDLDDMDFFAYFPQQRKKEARPLTLNMLIESARAGRWLYD